MKCCYELNIEISDAYKERVKEIYDLCKDDAKKDVAPDCMREEFPELWAPIEPVADWFSPVVRMLYEPPGQKVVKHIDLNAHAQYGDAGRYIICPGALNIPCFNPIGDITKWWRQKNPQFIHPYDFWKGTEHDMEEIDSFEITTKPVMLRTGVFHSAENNGNENRLMVSFFTHWTVDWDTIIDVMSSNGLLLPR